MAVNGIKSQDFELFLIQILYCPLKDQVYFIGFPMENYLILVVSKSIGHPEKACNTPSYIIPFYRLMGMAFINRLPIKIICRLIR